MRANQWRQMLGAAALVGTIGSMALAQTDIHAEREAFMKGMGARVGVLVGMVQGKQPYDAEAAKTAAAELQERAESDWAPLFPAGSDADTLGVGKALPKIWDNMDDFLAHKQKLAEAAAALTPVAGNGLDTLKASMGAVGGSCGSCHETYRR